MQPRADKQPRANKALKSDERLVKNMHLPQTQEGNGKVKTPICSLVCDF